MKWKQLLLVVAVSATSAVGSVWTYNKFTTKRSAEVAAAEYSKYPANYARYSDNIAGAPADPIDFTKAASTAVPAVVHIKTKIPAKRVSNIQRNRNGSIDDWFDQFFQQGFGPQVQPEQRASGSGVLISDD